MLMQEYVKLTWDEVLPFWVPLFLALALFGVVLYLAFTKPERRKVEDLAQVAILLAAILFTSQVLPRILA